LSWPKNKDGWRKHIGTSGVKIDGPLRIVALMAKHHPDLVGSDLYTREGVRGEFGVTRQRVCQMFDVAIRQGLIRPVMFGANSYLPTRRGMRMLIELLLLSGCKINKSTMYRYDYNDTSS
jgi:hypothetical protein